MKNNNEILCLVVKLFLSIVIAFVFAFKYKPVLISTLSEPIYYQVLVLTTIVSGYIATYVSSMLYVGHVFLRRKVSKEYNMAYITQRAKIFDTNSDEISAENKEKIKEILQHDLQKDTQINALFDELQKAKRDKKS